MAAEVEEVVVNADALHSKHLLPDFRELLFDLIAWFNVAVLRSLLHFVECRQRAEVELAIQRERQLFQVYEDVGNCFFDDAVSQKRVQLGAVEFRLSNDHLEALKDFASRMSPE